MNLTPIQKQRIAEFSVDFREYLASESHFNDLDERNKRHELYVQQLSPERLKEMTELEFGQIISSLWASLIWGNKSYLVDKLIADNGLDTLRVQLKNLLWGSSDIVTRYDTFRRSVKGLGSASVTELLAFVHPDECGLWNDKARKGLVILGFGESFSPLRKSQITGHEYRDFNRLLALILEELKQNGVRNLDYLGGDYFLYEVWESAHRHGDLFAQAVSRVSAPGNDTDFDHDEVVDQLVAIGQWLGFEAEKEKLVAKGAKVDAVWQARIANLGAVTYVFEVQRRGSYDSLILNLQRAQNNHSVQRLVVVANPNDISRIRDEIAGLPESFRRSVSFMDVAEAVRAADLLGELSSIIDKLELVRSEFAVR